MKLLKFNARITNINEIQEIHARITKNMKILKFQLRITGAWYCTVLCIPVQIEEIYKVVLIFSSYSVQIRLGFDVSVLLPPR